MKIKRIIAAIFALSFCAFSFAQEVSEETDVSLDVQNETVQKENDFGNLRIVGMSGGFSLPIECKDIKAMGSSINASFDWTYPVSDNFSLGFYVGLGAGFMGRLQPYSSFDQTLLNFKFSAGLMMEFGDKESPFVLAFCPCAGLGFVDMDLVLPLEVRFGKFIFGSWYLMGELSYGLSLAGETVCLEPGIRVGYNFFK